MQRLDDQFLMRPSEAPHLKRLPSEYMRDHCWYTTQPMESNNLKALECTLDMIKADTQLLYASDWPHFDFDLPSEITDLPFLSEQAKKKHPRLERGENLQSRSDAGEAALGRFERHDGLAIARGLRQTPSSPPGLTRGSMRRVNETSLTAGRAALHHGLPGQARQ